MRADVRRCQEGHRMAGHWHRTWNAADSSTCRQRCEEYASGHSLVSSDLSIACFTSVMPQFYRTACLKERFLRSFT